MFNIKKFTPQYFLFYHLKFPSFHSYTNSRDLFYESLLKKKKKYFSNDWSDFIIGRELIENIVNFKRNDKLFFKLLIRVTSSLRRVR